MKEKGKRMVDFAPETDASGRQRFQLLKPKDNGNWHGYGNRKYIKSVNDLFERKRYDLYSVEPVLNCWNEYRRKINQSDLMLSEKGLVCKIEA